MDGSTYYYNGHQDDDSPTLSPLSATFDNYLGEDLSFFSPVPNGPLSGLPPGAFSMTPRTTSLGQSTSTYPLDFQQTEDGLQDPYLGDPLRLMTSTANPVAYPAQSAAGSASPQLPHSSTLDSTMFFLPSPPEVEEPSCYTPPESSSDRRSEKRRRRSRRPLESGSRKPAAESPTDDTHATQQSSTTQLRTASQPQRAQQPGLHARKVAGAATEDVRARVTHNHVEQQYRKRLNTQFQKLLAVLPPAEGEGKGPASDGEDAKTTGGVQKRISKAEVLDLARRRIKTLESERAVLESQKRELAGCVGRLQDEWARRLGGDMPIKMEG